MLSFGLHRLFLKSINVFLTNYSVANDVTPEMTDEINYATRGAKIIISDDQNCHDTPLILTCPSNCSTILLRIIVCLDNGETAHLSSVAYRMATS